MRRRNVRSRVGYNRLQKQSKPLAWETPETLEDIATGRRVMIHLFGEPVLGTREIAERIPGLKRSTAFNYERKALAKVGAAIRRAFA